MSRTERDRPATFFHRRTGFPAGAQHRLAHAMQFVRLALTEWHLDAPEIADGAPYADDALLVAAELLSNAEEHGKGVHGIRLDLDPGRQRLRIAVTDAHPQSQPRPVAPHRPDRPRGHGLHILSLLTTWGTVNNADGTTKTVWAEVPVRTPLQPER